MGPQEVTVHRGQTENSFSRGMARLHFGVRIGEGRKSSYRDGRVWNTCFFNFRRFCREYFLSEQRLQLWPLLWSKCESAPLNPITTLRKSHHSGSQGISYEQYLLDSLFNGTLWTDGLPDTCTLRGRTVARSHLIKCSWAT